MTFTPGTKQTVTLSAPKFTLDLTPRQAGALLALLNDVEYNDSLHAVQSALGDFHSHFYHRNLVEVTTNVWGDHTIKVTDNEPTGYGSEYTEDVTSHEGRVTVALNDSEVMRHMRDGKKINAIKRVHEVTSCGLKEAKETVEDTRVVNASGYNPPF